MGNKQFVYLDNAATSWPKPDVVLDAIQNYYRHVGGAAGRGSTGRSGDANRIVAQCRLEIARVLNAQDGHIVFCSNGTDGLNTAIGGVLRDGDHVVISDTEHNSVLRPVNEWARQGRITFDLVHSRNGALDPEAIAAAVKAKTRLACLSHVSNVTGIEQDIRLLISAVKGANPEILVLVDGAQSVGHIPVDVDEFGCDLLVAAGHKGLQGPLGTGFLYLNSRAAEIVRPTRFGGTGTQSESVFQPQEMPYRLEAGNLNVGGIAGLLAGVRFVAERGVAKVAADERRLACRLANSLRQISGVHLYGRDDSTGTGVVSFNLRNQDPQTVAAILDAEFGIQIRSGYHCAPLMHKQLGTESIGGTLRASVGLFNTEEDVENLASAVGQVAGQYV